MQLSKWSKRAQIVVANTKKNVCWDFEIIQPLHMQAQKKVSDLIWPRCKLKVRFFLLLFCSTNLQTHTHRSYGSFLMNTLRLSPLYLACCFSPLHLSSVLLLFVFWVWKSKVEAKKISRCLVGCERLKQIVEQKNIVLIVVFSEFCRNSCEKSEFLAKKVQRKSFFYSVSLKLF